MSNEYKEQFLESRYSEYIEQGYSPKDSALLAYEDYEHDSYSYIPDENYIEEKEEHLLHLSLEEEETNERKN
jgi:hypothetical protein